MIVEDAFNNKKLLEINGCQFVVNPMTEQIPATSAELLKEAAQRIIEAGSFELADKIVGEEDKGGILVSACSLMTGLPFGMARWYPSELSVGVQFDCEYTKGKLFLNGVEKGDKIIIVDDMVSTGGTMIGLVRAVEKAGGEIVDIVSLTEKIEYNGVERIKRETGYNTKVIVQISVCGPRSKVL